MKGRKHMRSIVIEILTCSKESMNGTPFTRYKLKLLAEDSVFTTDCFSYTNEVIQVGNILEHMLVVGKLKEDELTAALEKSKKLEEDDRQQCNKGNKKVHCKENKNPKTTEMQLVSSRGGQLSLFSI